MMKGSPSAAVAPAAPRLGMRELPVNQIASSALPPRPAKSPSPPISICRRLSYESAQTRSRTRTTSRSRSAPPSQQQQQQQQEPPRTLPSVQCTLKAPPAAWTKGNNAPQSQQQQQRHQQPPQPAEEASVAACKDVVAVSDNSSGSPNAASPEVPVSESSNSTRPHAQHDAHQHEGVAALQASPAYIKYDSPTASPSPVAVQACPAAKSSHITITSVTSPSRSCGVANIVADSTQVPCEGTKSDDAIPTSNLCAVTTQAAASGNTEHASPPHADLEKATACPATPPQQQQQQQQKPRADVSKRVAPFVAEKTQATRTTNAALFSTSACTPDEAKPKPQQQQQQPSPQGMRHAASPPAKPATESSAAPPQHAAPPPPPRRSRSASSGLRGANTIQPAPRLRSGINGPSPFAADQLAMPRRPSPASSPSFSTHHNNSTSRTTGSAAAATAAGPPSVSVKELTRPPQVQLARPSGLYRQSRPAAATTTLHTAATAVSTAAGVGSTSLAASQLPGAAAAQERLLVSRLTRTASTSAAVPPHTRSTGRADVSAQRRRTPSAEAFLAPPQHIEGAGVSPLKRRSASACSVGVAAQPRRHRTPSASFTYTTRGRERGGKEKACGSTTSTSGGTSVVSAASPSQPSSRLRTAISPTSVKVVAGTATAGALRSASAPIGRRTAAVTNGGNGGGGAGPIPTRSAALITSPPPPSSPGPASQRIGAGPQRTSLTRTASGTTRGSVSAGGTSPGKVRRIASTSSLSHAPSSAGDRSSVSAGGPPTSRLARRTGPGAAPASSSTGVRPMISAGVAGAAGVHRSRPVVSATAGTATSRRANPSVAVTSGGATRRVTQRSTTTTARGSSGGHTVSAAQSSMITMEESREFLEEFQRMNQRELALFGTLLSTVATEQQQQQQQKQPASPVNHACDAGTGKNRIVVQSAEELSVWRRGEHDASHNKDQPQQLKPPSLPERETKVTARANHAVGDNSSAAKESADAAAEVVVLVRRSCSRATPSPSLSPTRRINLDSAEKERSPSPRPHLPATSQTSHAAGPLASTDAAGAQHDDASPEVVVDMSSSPSPRPSMKGGARTRAVVTTIDSNGAAAAGGGGVGKLSGSACASRRAAVKAMPPQKTSTLSAGVRAVPGGDSPSARRRRRRVATAATAAPTDLNGKALPEQGRQRSVTSYTDARSYSRHHDSAQAEQNTHVSLGGGVVREYSPVAGAEQDGVRSDAVTSAAAVNDAPPPPLAALRRAKELAAEQAAALVQRQRERQQQQQQLQQQQAGTDVDGDRGVSRTSPSMFSSCGSPSAGSSLARPSGGVGGPLSEVSEVRMSAAQLQLLIDGSRSRQNWERYQQL